MRSATILPADGRQAVKSSWTIEQKNNSFFNIISALIHTLSVYTHKMFPGNRAGFIAAYSTIREQIITLPQVRKEKGDSRQANINHWQEVEIDIANQMEKFIVRPGSFAIVISATVATAKSEDEFLVS